jgi:hypothetical protein
MKTMTQLEGLAHPIRSKARPFELTFDILFEADATYSRVKNSGAFTRDVSTQRYNLPANDGMFFCRAHAVPMVTAASVIHH